MGYFDTVELKERQVLEGITLRSIAGDKAMMTFFEFKEGSAIPSHSHPHEQITYVLEGEIEFNLGGEVRALLGGQGVVVYANEEHSALVTRGPARALDAWYPIREDYRL